ncbi:Helicase Sen1, N-terminal [Colletotrichum sp. SAR11_240]|nr:Helicase Sen1, N-terminal [Colletotrichum sp. SAR11_240]
MPGYDQPTASSSRKAVDKLPSPTRARPESHAGQGYARESSVCSDIGPSLTIKQRPETPQQDTQHARAEPEHPASSKTKQTTIFPALKKKSVGRSAHLDRELYLAAMEREYVAKDLSSTNFSKNLRSANVSLTDSSSTDLSTTGDANSQTLDHLPRNAIPADAEDAKHPNNTVLKTLGHSAEPAKEQSAAPATVATRPEPSPFQPNMSPPPPTPGLRPTMTTAGPSSGLTASRAPAVVKRYASLAPRLPIRVHASPSSSVSPLTAGRKCMWCGGREHASVDCDKVCTQCGSSSHTRGGCGSSSGF